MLDDKKLMDLLSDIGHQIEGYQYTERTVAKGLDQLRVLESRKEELERSIAKLIGYVLAIA